MMPATIVVDSFTNDLCFFFELQNRFRVYNGHSIKNNFAAFKIVLIRSSQPTNKKAPKMSLAISMTRLLSTKHIRHGQGALRVPKSNLRARQNRSFSSLHYGYGCECTAEEDERLLNDLAYSLAMASLSDNKVFPLGHEPNQRQKRQLWLSKTQPLLDQRWVEKKSICDVGPVVDAKDAF